ncbi:MAG: ABC transporter ATP-binding protein [Actinobacteria bacterium]|nr:ABC transporter ATP-binding protein [Actinomycetota bacterium]
MPTDRPPGPPVIEARGVTKAFDGVTAVHGVSLTIDPGRRVGLIGPNGAGKTTLFNCLLGVVSVDSGTVEVDGHDVTGRPVHQIARLGVGRTFQRIELFAEATVREHLLIAERTRRGGGSLWKDLIGRGRPRLDEIEACDRVLELLGLDDVADQASERLSLGRGRLLEIGRALMTRPKILLLDEPSSGLDSAETERLAETLLAVQSTEGFAVLLVEHDVAFVENFTERCYAMDTGALIGEGPTAEVLASDAVREAYLGSAAVTR